VGEREVALTQRFFARVESRDERLGELLDEMVVFTNVEGLCTIGREAVSRVFLEPGDRGARHELLSVEATAGRARARFALFVAGLQGGLVFEADLQFEGDRLTALEVRAG
jgi:hypothetical protein